MPLVTLIRLWRQDVPLELKHVCGDRMPHITLIRLWRKDNPLEHEYVCGGRMSRCNTNTDVGTGSPVVTLKCLWGQDALVTLIRLWGQDVPL
jgi:hypothetical protein